ncbi:MAG TPA: TetR family transcriptional regulator [Acidimicrobiales bacterium]
MPVRRGRPATVSRDQVVDAALRVAREVGLDRLTMSRVAAELGVAQMTVYHHVGSRAELGGLVVERLLDGVVVPEPDGEPWDVQLKALQASVRRQLGSVGGVTAGLKVDLDAASGRLADAVLAILARAGFDEHTARLAFGALFTYMLGQLDVDVAARPDRPADDRTAELGRQFSTRRLDADDVFDFGFDLLLAGLRQLLPPAEPVDGGGRGGAG